jgi:predicted transcriptional regulator
MEKGLIELVEEDSVYMTTSLGRQFLKQLREMQKML